MVFPLRSRPSRTIRAPLVMGEVGDGVSSSTRLTICSEVEGVGSACCCCGAVIVAGAARADTADAARSLIDAIVTCS